MAGLKSVVSMFMRKFKGKSATVSAPETSAPKRESRIVRRRRAHTPKPKILESVQGHTNPPHDEAFSGSMKVQRLCRAFRRKTRGCWKVAA